MAAPEPGPVSLQAWDSAAVSCAGRLKPWLRCRHAGVPAWQHTQLLGQQPVVHNRFRVCCLPVCFGDHTSNFLDSDWVHREQCCQF